MHTDIQSLLQQLYFADIIIPTIQMRKLKLRGLNRLLTSSNLSKILREPRLILSRFTMQASVTLQVL